MAFSAETTARLEAIRAKVLAGTDTREDLAEGLRILREDRVGAQIASTSSRSKKAADAAPVDAAAALAGLRALGTKLMSGPVA
jgi:hypothetical protein